MRVRQSVRRWRARFLARRLDGLGDVPRPGVPRTITDAQVEELVAVSAASRVGTARTASCGAAAGPLSRDMPPPARTAAGPPCS
jgi:transposase